jgi:hypothetical protein
MKARISIIALATLTTACTAFSQVSVFVWQENLQNQVVYHYRVSNNASHGLLGVEIGINQVHGGDSQLSVPPIGVVVDEDFIPPDAIGIPVPSTSVTTPAGWSASVIGSEGDDKISVEFEVTDTAVLRAGNHRGFSITVPVADEAYRTGGWQAFMEWGVVVWGTLAADETDAPTPTALVSGGASVCGGTSVPVSVVLSGNGRWSLQWADGLAQTVTSSPAVRAVTPATTTRYLLSSVRDINRFGTASGFADATILNPPLISTPPASRAVKKGTTTTLGVIASGVAPLSYQWFKGTSGTTTTPVGTNSASFTTPKITAATTYWVRVTNSCGSTNSVTASITLQ